MYFSTASGFFYGKGESLRGLGSHHRQRGKQENSVCCLVAERIVIIIVYEIAPGEERVCLGC